MTAQPVAAGHPFGQAEYAGRIERLRRRMAEADLDLAIVTSPENIYYLSGYMTRAVAAHQFLAVPASGSPLLATRRRDIGNLLGIAEYTPIKDHATYDDHDGASPPVAVLLDLLRAHDVAMRRVGFEKQSTFLLVDHYEQFARAHPNASLVDVSLMIEEMRLRKSPAEIACHRRAGDIVVAGVAAAIDASRPGNTDGHVAARTASALIESGSEWIATWPVIRTGRNTGRAHASWEHVTIERGLPTTIETAGVVARYHTPLYVSVIDGPTPEQRDIAAVIRDTTQAAVEAMRPGIATGDVFAAAEKVVARAGRLDMLIGRVGYTVGIGFPPNWVQRLGVDIVRNGKRVLEPDMVFHMVVALARPNHFSIGQSASVLLTAGGAEVLTAGLSAEPVLRD